MTSFDSETEPIEFENLAKLAENIVYLLPGCTDLMVRKTIQDVYRDFCRRTCCLRARRHFRSSDRSVIVSPMYGGVVDCVVSVRVDGMDVLRDGRANVVKDPVFRVLLHRFNGITGAVDERERDVEIEHIEFPKITSESAPSWFVDRYGEFIVSGVLSRLQAMTGRAWSDQFNAAQNLAKYENGVNEARIDYHSPERNGDLGRAIPNDELI